jgi:GAF domain-containing protein
MLRNLGRGFVPSPSRSVWADAGFRAVPEETMNLADRYVRVRAQLIELCAKTDDPLARMATVVAVLHHKLPHFFWTGFYLSKNDGLIVGPYQGPLACAVLPGPAGVCWEAMRRGEPVRVPDVHAFAGHVACDARSKSEIVVPVRDATGRIVGVLDVDSDKPDAFSEVDAQGLEAIVALIHAAQTPDLPDALRRLLARQPLAVLATQGQGQPHASLLGFAASEDLSKLVFATPRATRKFENLTADGRAALLVDDRANRPDDIMVATAATAIGRVEEIGHAEREAATQVYLRRHPHLRSFLDSPDTAVLRMTVERYFVVRRFQEVTEVRPPIRAT